MGLYINNRNVEDLLLGKVRFVDDTEDGNIMTRRALNLLVNQAEGQVEMDLSMRYATPFQTAAGLPFSSLTERPTKQFLRALCEIMSVIRVLETDFGRGAIDSDDYVEKLQKRYDGMVEKLMKERVDGQNQFVYPPLPDLRKAYFNTEADDGFRGMILNTSDEVSYSQNQINDPGETFWNVSFEDIFGANSGGSTKP